MYDKHKKQSDLITPLTTRILASQFYIGVKRDFSRLSELSYRKGSPCTHLESRRFCGLRNLRNSDVAYGWV